MNITHFVELLDTLRYGDLPTCRMRAFHSCSADESPVFRVGRNTSGQVSVVNQYRGYSVALDELSVTGDVLFQMFRSYSTFCAVSIVTDARVYVLVTHAPTNTTNSHICKYIDDMRKTGPGYRINLYPDSKGTIATAFRAALPVIAREDRTRGIISAKRSSSFELYALPSKWHAYFDNAYPSVFTPDLTRALSSILYAVHGVDYSSVL